MLWKVTVVKEKMELRWHETADRLSQAIAFAKATLKAETGTEPEQVESMKIHQVDEGAAGDPNQVRVPGADGGTGSRHVKGAPRAIEHKPT